MIGRIIEKLIEPIGWLLAFSVMLWFWYILKYIPEIAVVLWVIWIILIIRFIWEGIISWIIKKFKKH